MTFVVITAAAEQSTGSSISIVSVLGGVAVSFLSAILVYTARQSWERKKLKRALLTEVEEMEGIKSCADQMKRISSPPGRQLTPDDVPTSDSIPTTIYQTSASKIGLLGGFRHSSELQGVVRFYSKATRYKSIIRDIGNSSSPLPDGGDTARAEEESAARAEFDSMVSDDDQEQLYNNIRPLEEVRQDIIEKGTFDVDYPKDLK